MSFNRSLLANSTAFFCSGVLAVGIYASSNRLAFTSNCAALSKIVGVSFTRSGNVSPSSLAIATFLTTTRVSLYVNSPDKYRLTTAAWSAGLSFSPSAILAMSAAMNGILFRVSKSCTFLSPV